MQGCRLDERELLDAESVAGHLVDSGSVFRLLAEHRRVLFPEAMFADLFPSGRGRPSVPVDIAASILVLQALHGLSDREAMAALRTDLRWKVACGLPIGHGGYDASTLTYWRKRAGASCGRVRRTGVTPEALDSTVKTEGRCLLSSPAWTPAPSGSSRPRVGTRTDHAAAA